MWRVGIQNSTGDIFDTIDPGYVSLAGINYPTAPTAWQQLSLVNGTKESLCTTGPAYYASGNVVYLDGFFIPTGGSGTSGEIAVLPAGDRPAHFLYMIAYSDGPGSQYVTLRIDPSGVISYFAPPSASTFLVTLSGLSFHLGS
jgi:hypothetical protein